MRKTHARMAEQHEAEEAEAARKQQEEERVAEQRRQRELERAAAAEEARKKAQREQEAEERARMRNAQAKTSAPPDSGWRARTQAQTAPARAQSPVPAASPVSATGPPKIAGAGGWRQRMAEKEKQVGAAVVGTTTSSPAATSAPLPKDTDGFETVAEKKVWRPRRLQNQA